jgi:MoaA/NifB/PqqE/SkfB family radical SAM enzyme
MQVARTHDRSQGTAGISPPEFDLYHPRAGHPDWLRLRAEAVERARRLRATLVRPRQGWPEYRRRLRSYATAARNYLTNRRLMRDGRGDLRPLYFIWTLLRSCNFRCEYCDDHRGRRYPELPREGVLTTEQAIRLLRIMRTRTPSVYFSGGEPLLRRDLPRLTQAARDLSYYPIIVNTNGSVIDRLLDLPGWRTWLADTDIVIVSLDGLDLETLAHMWHYPHPERIIRNLLLLRELAQDFRVKLMVNTVIQPTLIEHARDVLDVANDLGIWFCPVPLNVGPGVHHALRDDPEYVALAELILERKRLGYPISGSLRMLRRLLRFEPLACYNTLKPHIDHDGRLFWPCKASVNTPPVLIDVLQFDNVDALYDHAARTRDPARFHGAGRDQCGATCNWAQNYSTDAYAHGLLHPFSLLTDIAEFVQAR